MTNIAAHGVHLQWVAAGDGDPCFAYTVGLQAFDDHPELITFGANGEDSQVILNNFVFRIRDRVQRFETPLEVRDFGSGYPVRLHPVADSTTHLTAANAMYRIGGGPPIRALQVVWPDVEQRWPWEAGSTLTAYPDLAQADFDKTASLPQVDLVPHDPEQDPRHR